MKKTCTYFMLACLVCSVQFCFALITVNSVHVTTSTCPNNGTATIFASSTSDSAVFLYNIIAGPELYPLQNDSTFASLYPGTYTARVHDVNSYDSTETTFTITGNYTAPVISATTTSPLCPGETGEIICSLEPSTGFGPYTWAIASPDTTAPQASDIFTNLTPGTYLMKITDACHVVRTVDATINAGGTGLGWTNAEPALYFIGCDTVVFSASFELDKDKGNLPVKITSTTSHGSVSKYIIPTVNDTFIIPSVYVFLDTIYNVNYGDYLSICITDTCHETICYPYDSIAPFKFQMLFATVTGNCEISYIPEIELQPAPFKLDYIYDFVPVKVILENMDTHVVVDSFVIDSASFTFPIAASLPIPQQPSNDSYQFTVSDRCGDFYQGTVQFPAPVVPDVTLQYGTNICLDSNASVQFNFSGFGSGVTLDILSGPPFSESTTPGYAYRNNLSYPIIYGEINKAQYTVENMPAGSYVYRVTDSCGNVFLDSFTIYQVYSMDWTHFVQAECGGLNTLNIVPSYSGTSTYTRVFDISTQSNLQVIDDNNVDECQNLSPGQYVIIIDFYRDQDTALLGNNNCWTYIDTVTIGAYNDSIIKATDVVTCNGTSYIQIEVDSANGVVPFQYEIISGPQTFAPQNSSSFIVNYFGTYVLGVIDACGDVDTRQVTIDSGRFDPVARSGGWCAGTEVQLTDVSSPFFTYIWQKPGGSFYTGDTLTINPFTSADTGLYLITKIVQINSCRDTAYGNYHLVFQDTFQQSASICPGDTLRVGSHIHTTSGTYADTLTGSGGCDSIEVTKLIVQNLPVTIDSSGSPVCHNQPITLTATAPGGISYVWSTFQYTEGITVDPSATTTYTVTVNTAVANCSGTASITVYPVSEDTVLLTQNKTIICPTDSAIICASSGFTTYNWNVGYTSQCITVSQPGDYYVTATNSAGCPFVSGTEHLSVYPTTSVSLTVHGDTITSLNQEAYQWYLNNDPILGDTTATIIARISGAYTVQLTDSNGCTNTSNPVIISGINNILTGDEIKVYPNPTANGTWQVEISTSLIGSACEVFDAEGRLVYSGHLNSPKSTVAMQVLSGVYIMKIQSATGNYSVKLIQF